VARKATAVGEPGVGAPESVALSVGRAPTAGVGRPGASQTRRSGGWDAPVAR
jgi:hypothetical protein